MQERIKTFIKQSLGLEEEPTVEIPVQASFGHYSTNLAMQLAKEGTVLPLQLAQELVSRLVASDKNKMFSKIETAGPGFINFWLAPEFLLDNFLELFKEKKLKGPSIGKKQRIILDYSQPNIAKRMHVGHMRSTIIGDSLANIFDYLGYKTIRWNYYGDWGTQFGKLIAAYKLWGSEEDVKNAPIETLLSLYVQFHMRSKNDPLLENKGRIEFKKLEDGDKENRRLWGWFKKESLIEFNRIYKRLGIKFDVEYGEAYYQDSLVKLIKKLKNMDLVEKSHGALVIPLGEDIPPALIQKSDGATLYMTRDIASLIHRIKKYKPKKILYIVSNEQTLHFTQFFMVAKKMGFTKTELAHIKFGLVLNKGKKLSTRGGGAVRLEELINKAVDFAYKIVSEKNPDLAEQERRQVAETVGIGALKYSDLKENRNSDIIFDWDRMLDLRGDTAPYIQYTVVRLNNIVRKSGLKKIKRINQKRLEEPLELEIIKKLLDFNDILVACAERYMTSYLAKYLNELAQKSNQYYERVRILEDEDKDMKTARLALVSTVVKTLDQGLKLLGIGVPERI